MNATVTDAHPAKLTPCPEGTTRDGNNIHNCVPVTPAPSMVPTLSPTDSPTEQVVDEVVYDADITEDEFRLIYTEHIEFDVDGYNSANVPEESLLIAVRLTITQSDGAVIEASESDEPAFEIGTGKVKIGKLVFTDPPGSAFNQVHVAYDLIMTDGDIAKKLGDKYQKYQDTPDEFVSSIKEAISYEGQAAPEDFGVKGVTYRLQAESEEIKPATAQALPSEEAAAGEGVLRGLRRRR